MALVGTNRSSLTTRMPNGVTNAAIWQTMGNSGTTDPTWSHRFWTDFDTYTATDWSLTGTSGPTAALTPGDGGLLLLSTANTTAADSAYLQKTPAAFKNVAGKQMFFKFAGTLSSIAPFFYTGVADIGEGIEGSTVDGIIISKAATATVLNLDIFVASVKTSFAFPTACVVAAGVYFEVGFAIDPNGNVLGYFNPTTGAGTPITAFNTATTVQPRGAVVLAATPALPTTNMAPVVGMTNSVQAANTCTIDFLVTSRER